MEVASIPEAPVKRLSKQVLCSLKDGKPYVPNKYPVNVACVNVVKVVTVKTQVIKFPLTITKKAPKPTVWVSISLKST